MTMKTCEFCCSDYLSSTPSHVSARAQVVHELIERFEAHLTAGSYFSVVANMRGDSAEAVAAAILSCEGLGGLQVRHHQGFRILSKSQMQIQLGYGAGSSVWFTIPQLS